MKTCTRCKEELEPSEFRKDKSKKDGLSTRCRACLKEVNKTATPSRRKRAGLTTNKIEIEQERKELADVGKKRCGNCLEVVSLELFFKDKKKKDGLATACKACKSEYEKSPAGIAKRKRYEQSEHGKAKVRAYRTSGEGRIKYYKTMERYFATEKGKQARKRYYTSAKGRKYARERGRELAKDPQFRLKRNISTGIWRGLKAGGGSKAGSCSFDVLGYTRQELKEHLESKFKPGMSWDNYGTWHIDHIIPDSHFKYSSVEDTMFKECWSLTNLQPLWAEENIKKSNKILGVI